MVKAGFTGLFTIAFLAPAGERNQNGVVELMPGSGSPRHFDAVHARHPDIEQDHVWIELIDDFQCLRPAVGGAHAGVQRTEEHPQHVAGILIVVNDEHAAVGKRSDGARLLDTRLLIENERQTGINPSEAVEEKVSLSDRFGLWLGFHACNQDDFLAMIRGYCDAFGIAIRDAELRAEAIEWSQTRGGRSGRVAWQYVTDLAGRRGVRLDDAGDQSGA